MLGFLCNDITTFSAVLKLHYVIGTCTDSIYCNPVRLSVFPNLDLSQCQHPPAAVNIKNTCSFPIKHPNPLLVIYGL